MEHPQTGDAGELRCMGRSQAATRSDGDASSALFAQPPKAFGSSENIGRAARGQQSPAAGYDDVLQGTLEINRFIEGAMEGDFKAIGAVNQPPHSLNVDLAICEQNSGDETAGAKRASALHLPLDQSELVAAINEATRTRTQQNIYRQIAALDCRSDHGRARRKAALLQGRTKLDAVRSPVARSHTGLCALSTEFEDNRRHPFARFSLHRHLRRLP
jgi:hypothetical protein